MYEYIVQMFKDIEFKRYCNVMKGVSYIYVVWIAAHYVASHMYVWFCVPATFIGFLTAPFLVPAPHCQAIRWTIYTGGEKIFAMWMLIGSWLFNKIEINRKND